MLHAAGQLEYASAQASTSYYAAGHSDLEYGQHHPTAPPTLNVGEHYFSGEVTEAELQELALNHEPSSNMRTYHSQHNTPDYESRQDF